MLLRDWRRQNKISMEELSRRLRVTRQAISAWENGRAMPRLELAFRIARITKGEVNLSDLYGLKKKDEAMLIGEPGPE